jgi:pimeloyl-ACP methyl ester carboxylesterase
MRTVVSKMLWLGLVLLMTGTSFSQSKNSIMPHTPITSKTVVFIHGLFVNPKGWNEWKAYFEAHGYTCLTPANPYHAGNPADLRNHVDPRLGQLGFKEVVDNIVKLIDSLPEKPIVIGHSLAGLVVQKLVEMNKVAAGISIDGAPPKNVLPGLRTFRTMFPVINPLKGNSVYLSSRKWFHRSFCTTLSLDASNRVYDSLAVPESRNIPRNTIFKTFAKINFKKPHSPLLFIGGEKDMIIPAGLSRKNARAYRDKNSISDFKEFKGRCHYICGQEGWQEVADYVIGWLGQ